MKIKSVYITIVIGVIISGLLIISSCGNSSWTTKKDNGARPVQSSLTAPGAVTGNDITQLKSVKRDSIRHLINVASFWVAMFPDNTHPITGPSMIEDGVLIIEPTNPFTNNKMVFSKEYSPGEIYFYCGELLPGEPMQAWHYDPSEPKYDDQLAASGEWISPKAESPEYKFNGHTEKISPDIPPEGMPYEVPYYMDFREQCGYADTPDAALKVIMVADQLDALMKCYSSFNDEVPDSLDAYIEWLGLKNPKAWTNPYTGGEMHQVPLVKTNTFSENRDIPLLPEPEATNEYAGNYAYDTYARSSDGMIISIARFYFLDSEGLLQSKNCKGFPAEVMRSWSKNLIG